MSALWAAIDAQPGTGLVVVVMCLGAWIVLEICERRRR